MTVLFLAGLFGGSRSGTAKPNANYIHYENQWNDLQSRYKGEEAVVVNEDTESRMLESSQGDVSVRTTRTETVVVFDLHENSDVLDRSFLLAPGEKLKKIWAWSHEHGSGDKVAWAEKSDIHKKKVFGRWTQILLSVPGLSKAGVCQIQMETARDGFPYVSYAFTKDIPVVKGEYRIQLLSRGGSWSERMNEVFQEGSETITRGDVEELPLTTTSEGKTLAFRVHDLPARPRERYVDAWDLPRAEFFITSSWWKWSDELEYYGRHLKEMRAPKAMAKAVRDTLSGKPPREIVKGVCRILDDSQQFRLQGEVRSGTARFPNLRTVVKEARGDAFDKVVLAHALLRKAHVKSYLVMAASRHHSVPDWRIVDTRFLNGFLLWIPAISDEFLWDVADRTVPPGKAGPDLYPEMIVVDPESDQPTHGFSLGGVTRFEDRRVDWSLDEDGEMAGAMTCRFGGWPMVKELDPWDRTQHVQDLFQESCPQGIEADSVKWEKVDWQGMRCSAESPAVLSCSLSGEATPFGDSGWQVEVLNWGLPDYLTGLDLNKRKLPVLLSDTVEVVQTVSLHPEGLQVKDYPAPKRIDNSVGGFSCTWESAEEGFVAKRKLRIPAGKVSVERLGEMAALLDAWKDSQLQVVTFQ